MIDANHAETLVRRLWRCFDQGRFQDARPLLAADFEAFWPNTRERIRGLENFIALNEAYPGNWRCDVEKVIAVPKGAVTVTRIRDGDVAFIAVSFFEVTGDRIARAEEFFGDVAEPPFDRSAWAEWY